MRSDEFELILAYIRSEGRPILAEAIKHGLHRSPQAARRIRAQAEVMRAKAALEAAQTEERDAAEEFSFMREGNYEVEFKGAFDADGLFIEGAHDIRELSQRSDR